MAPAYDQAVLKDNFIECLRVSDRTIITSFAVLFIGAVAARQEVQDGTVQLPVGGITVSSLDTALWIILGLHFVNGLRYFFLLLRARAISTRLDEPLRNASRFFPAAATNNIMMESLVTLVLTLLTFPIVDRMLPAPIWIEIGTAFLVSSPFIVADIACGRDLNAA